MMKRIFPSLNYFTIVMIAFFFGLLQANSQNSVGVGTNAPHSSAALDVTATDKGMLVPRMNSVQRTGIAAPANGLLVYDTDFNSFWYFDGTVWTELAGGSTTGDNLGNHIATQNIQLGSHWLSGDGGNEGIHVTSGGTVGIGTNAPARTLQIDGDFRVNDNGFPTAIVESTSGVGTWLSIGNTATDGKWFQFISTGPGNGEGVGKLILTRGVAPNSTAGIIMTADWASRSIGIGTTAPANRLTVAGNADITGRLGIGIDTAQAALDVKGNGAGAYLGGFATLARLQTPNDNRYSLIFGNDVAGAGKEMGIWMSNAGDLHLDNYEGAAVVNRLSILQNGNVGIGSGTPLAGLDVRKSSMRFGLGSSSVSVAPPAQTVADDYCAMYAVSAGGNATDFRFYVEDDPDDMISFWGNSCNGGGGCGDLSQSLNLLTIMGGGNIGISTTAPAEKLEISDDRPVITLVEPGISSFKIGNDNGLFKIAAMDNGFGGHIGDFEANDVQVISMLQNGRVGIGTVSPQQKLHVNGSFRITDTGFPSAIMESSSTVGTWLSIGNTATDGKWFQFISTGPGNSEGVGKLILTRGSSPGGTAGLLLTADWASLNIGIGTTTPADKLEVAGFTRTQGYRTRTGVGGSYGGNIYNFNWTGTNLHAYVDNVFVGTVSLTSDRRLKENITSISSDALDRVMQLKPVSYNYKNIEGSIFTGSDEVQEGFLADELQAVIPSAVAGKKDALTSDGDIQPLTVDIAPVVAVLTKAMQEQQTTIADLKLQIENLEIQNLKVQTDNEQLKQQVKNYQSQITGNRQQINDITALLQAIGQAGK